MLAFVIGTACKLNSLDDLGLAAYIIGGVLIAWIAFAGTMAPVIEVITEKRMQMDSARYLDIDRMAALGLTSTTVQASSETRITYEDQRGQRGCSQLLRPASPLRW